MSPLCREHLHTAGDVPSPHSVSAAYAKSLFPTIDTKSHFTGYTDKEFYFLEDLDKELNDEINQAPDVSVIEKVFTVQKRYLPDCMESKSSKLTRAIKFKEVI